MNQQENGEEVPAEEVPMDTEEVPMDTEVPAEEVPADTGEGDAAVLDQPEDTSTPAGFANFEAHLVQGLKNCIARRNSVHIVKNRGYGGYSSPEARSKSIQIALQSVIDMCDKGVDMSIYGKKGAEGNVDITDYTMLGISFDPNSVVAEDYTPGGVSEDAAVFSRPKFEENLTRCFLGVIGRKNSVQKAISSNFEQRKTSIKNALLKVQAIPDLGSYGAGSAFKDAFITNLPGRSLYNYFKRKGGTRRRTKSKKTRKVRKSKKSRKARRTRRR